MTGYLSAVQERLDLLRFLLLYGAPDLSLNELHLASLARLFEPETAAHAHEAILLEWWLSFRVEGAQAGALATSRSATHRPLLHQPLAQTLFAHLSSRPVSKLTPSVFRLFVALFAALNEKCIVAQTADAVDLATPAEYRLTALCTLEDLQGAKVLRSIAFDDSSPAPIATTAQNLLARLYAAPPNSPDRRGTEKGRMEFASELVRTLVLAKDDVVKSQKPIVVLRSLIDQCSLRSVSDAKIRVDQPPMAVDDTQENSLKVAIRFEKLPQRSGVFRSSMMVYAVKERARSAFEFAEDDLLRLFYGDVELLDTRSLGAYRLPSEVTLIIRRTIASETSLASSTLRPLLASLLSSFGSGKGAVDSALAQLSKAESVLGSFRSPPRLPNFSCRRRTRSLFFSSIRP